MDIGELLTRWYEAESRYSQIAEERLDLGWARFDRDEARAELVEAIKNATR